MPPPPALLGRWVIESMDMWSADDINLVEEGHVTFTKSGGEMAFICVSLWLDCNAKGDSGSAVEFTFEGSDEGDEVSGRGHARISGKDRIKGSIRFHMGDESGFVARRASGR